MILVQAHRMPQHGLQGCDRGHGRGDGGPCQEEEILPLEQKALRRGTRGCLDALAIDTVW